MKTRARNSSTMHFLQVTKPFILVLAFWVFGSGAAFGQGWVKTYGDSNGAGRSVIRGAFEVDSGIVALELQYFLMDTTTHVNYLKLNSKGNLISRQRLDLTIDSLSNCLIYHCDSIGQLYLYRTDQFSSGSSAYTETKFFVISNNGTLVASTRELGDVYSTSENGEVILEAQLPKKWSYSSIDKSLKKSLIAEFPGNILSSPFTADGSIITVNQGILQKIAIDGSLVWSTPLPQGPNCYVDVKLNQQNIYLFRWTCLNYLDSLSIEIYSPTGNLLKILPSQLLHHETQYFKTYLLGSDFAMTYHWAGQLGVEADLFVINNDLNVKCTSLPLSFDKRFSDIVMVSKCSGGYLVSGGNRYSNFGQIARIGENCSPLSNLLKINIFSDDNKDCLPEKNEITLKDKLVQITSKDQHIDYFSSGADTIFAALDTGQYVIHPKAPIYYKLCVDSINISHQKYNDTISVDIPLQPEVICPYLEVDISTALLRRCFNNTYSVRYCNQGTAIAKAAYIEVKLDKWLDYVSSTKPLSSQQGNLLRFDLGDLAVGDCGNFQIVSYLRCDSTVIEMTHCTDAHIFPDSLCLPSSGWDGSRIRVSGQCKGDSIEFEIRNASSSPMTQNSEYIVVEDEIIMMRKPFVLGANQSLRFGMPVYGRTYRVEAAQSQGHPGSSKPSVTIENCGSGPVSLGFVNQFAQDDADPFIDIDCQQSRGSFDPNDKQGFPSGYSVQKYIEPGQDIEYLIRFQNTGNDTAFTVRIHDTLSTLLDPTTIVPGASSHPYHYRLFGPGIIEFLFDPIALPDSTVNQTGSIGFVKFTIAQKKDVPLGSVIYNAASIYFDYNAPIITNTTKHTIGKNFITITELKELSPTSLKVYPNPFSQEAVIELKDSDASEKTFELFDLQGRSIRREIFTNNQLIFKRNQLSAGLYFFKVTDRKGVLAQGKLVVD